MHGYHLQLVYYNKNEEGVKKPLVVKCKKAHLIFFLSSTNILLNCLRSMHMKKLPNFYIFASECLKEGIFKAHVFGRICT